MIENKKEILSKVDKFLNTYNENDIVRKEIERMNDQEKLFLSHLLSNLTFIRNGIQPYAITIKFFCKIFEINTVDAVDSEIINTVSSSVTRFAKYMICEENGYGTRLLCGHKISWVTGMIILSPNPNLEKIQKRWKTI